VHKDHLGSTRLVSNLNQTIADNMDYLPFGEQISGASTTTHKFTSDERDSETASSPGANNGLDHTWFRQYSPLLGRWITPDPFAGYIDNPQSLNRYSYVLNSPTTFTDPLGLVCRDEPNAPCNEGNSGGGGGSGSFAGYGVFVTINSWQDAVVGWQVYGFDLDTGLISIGGCLGCLNNEFPVWGEVPITTQVFFPIVPGGGGGGGGGDSRHGGGGFCRGANDPLCSSIDPTKLPLCFSTFLSESAQALNPFGPSLSSAGDVTAAAYAANKFNAALKYAASRPNYLGGQGLIYPLKSVPFKTMLNDAKAASGAGLLISGDLALLQGFVIEVYQAYGGACRAF
jgi:RHS repeat-associated protein